MGNKNRVTIEEMELASANARSYNQANVPLKTICNNYSVTENFWANIV